MGWRGAQAGGGIVIDFQGQMGENLPSIFLMHCASPFCRHY
jgi:hypothetical protein